MEVLYALYDALVSINVPTDRARAVVTAMERDLGNTLATKSDVLALHQELHSEVAILRHEIQYQGAKITITLGSMVFLGVGVIVAVLKLS